MNVTNSAQCPVCSTVSVAKAFSFDDECDMFRCNRCGSGFLYPPPMASYTSDYYQPYVTPEDSLPRFIARHVHDGRSTSSDYRYVSQLREIESIMSKFTVGNSRRLLDVGCGMGGF